MGRGEKGDALLLKGAAAGREKEENVKLLIIRHGESEADILGVHEGRADFQLTEKGRDQARRMADWVAARYALDAIYSSTLKRARQTAESLSRASGAPVREDPHLMEFNNGLLAGLPYAVADERYPPVENLPVHASVYGQESLLAFRYRAENALSRVLSENPPAAAVALVTHGGMIGQLYRSFLRLPVDIDCHFATGDTGVHEWEWSPTRRLILRANSLAHLENV